MDQWDTSGGMSKTPVERGYQDGLYVKIGRQNGYDSYFLGE